MKIVKTDTFFAKVHSLRQLRPTSPCSDSPDHPDEETIKQENKKYGDILRIDTLDTYEALSAKTIKMFTILPDLIKADFYFKVDDDVAVNTDALITYLKGKRGQGNLYTVSLLNFHSIILLVSVHIASYF